MITKESAEKIVKKKFSDTKVSAVKDFKYYYVFCLSGKNGEILLDSMIGIYKNNGKMFVYNPLKNNDDLGGSSK